MAPTSPVILTFQDRNFWSGGVLADDDVLTSGLPYTGPTMGVTGMEPKPVVFEKWRVEDPLHLYSAHSVSLGQPTCHFMHVFEMASPSWLPGVEAAGFPVCNILLPGGNQHIRKVEPSGPLVFSCSK